MTPSDVDGFVDGHKHSDHDLNKQLGHSKKKKKKHVSVTPSVRRPAGRDHKRPAATVRQWLQQREFPRRSWNLRPPKCLPQKSKSFFRLSSSKKTAE